MQLKFNTYGNDKQKQAYRYWADDTTKDICYGGSKGSGKSYLGCSLIFGDALMYAGTHYFIARKKLNDLRKFTLPSIYEVLRDFGISAVYYHFNAQDNVFYIFHPDGKEASKVFLLEAKYMPSDPLYTRFGSIQMTRGMIEEAGEFEEAAKNNLHASIGRWKNEEYNLLGKLLQTCNPSKNYLYRDYYKANKEGTLPIWRKFIQALPQDNKRLPPGYLETLNDILDANQKERLLKGNWEYDDDPAILIEYEAIVNTFTNSHILENDGVLRITVDVARFGPDKTIAIVWKGRRAVVGRVWPKTSVVQTAEYIKNLKKEFKVLTSNIICDEAGVGGGVVDILECRGFVANAKPLKNKDASRTDSQDNNVPGVDAVENFDMLKSQCYFKLAANINIGLYNLAALKPYQEVITEELEQVKQKSMDSDLKKGVVPKSKVSELLGHSPDWSDTISMLEWFYLFNTTKAAKTRLPAQVQKNMTGLNPGFLTGSFRHK